MIAGFNEWAASAQLGHTVSLEQLRNHRLGIEAEDYINNLVSNPPTREPLLPALGGLPFSLEDVIKTQLATFKKFGVQPYFVFNGLNYNAQEDKLQASLKASKTIANAWDLYGASQPETAVNEFGTLCTLDVDNVYRFVQSILRKEGVSFLVAPYSAAGQLASISGTEFCDAISGSSEVLMFEVDKLITRIDFDSETLTLVTRKECVEALGCTSIGMFIDVCLLAGSSFLPTLPPLENDISPLPRAPKIRAAADLLKQRNANGNAVCQQYQQEGLVSDAYLERYRKALTSIKHHVIMRPDGEIATLDFANAPSDLNTVMGQRLPDELFTYMSRGIIGPQVPQWRSQDQIVERPPLDGGESATYQRIVGGGLSSIRSTTMELLSHSVHRFYNKQNVSISCWFDSTTRVLDLRSGNDPRSEIADWNVRLEQLGDRANSLEKFVEGLTFSMWSLEDAEFAKSTVTPVSAKYKPLSTNFEITYNALYRFLQLRGYVNKDHTISPLGKSLQAALNVISQRDEDLEDAVTVGLELIRLRALNADDMFPYVGAPQRGSDVDRRNTLLISRVACLAKLKHKSIGFTGPLSRHLLGYRDMASTVRSSLRNLVEMSLCAMLLNGQVARDISMEELADISFKLPFLTDVDCALGIAVKSYLDELSNSDDPKSAKAREHVKSENMASWFPHALDFDGDLQKAFRLWDAIYAAVAIAPAGIVSAKEKKMWAEANTWLSERR